MSNLLTTGLVQLVEASLNPLLRQDPHLLRSLNAVAAGKRLRVICTAANDLHQPWQLTVTISADKIHLHSNSADSADATIRGSKKALIQLLTSEDPASALHHPELDLDGDVHLVHAVHASLSKADTNWDDLLAPLLKPLTGDTGMAAGAAVINRSAALIRDSAQSLQLNLKDFLQEESGLLPTRSEVMAANDHLDALRLRLDRLAARIAQLRQHVTN